MEESVSFYPFRPKEYPGRRPSYSYFLSKDRVHEIRIRIHMPLSEAIVDYKAEKIKLSSLLEKLSAKPLQDRYAIIGFGSNVSPSRLIEKGIFDLPVVKTSAKNVDVVYAYERAHYDSEEAVPATIVRSTNTSVEIWVAFLDETQLKTMDRSEGRRTKHYDLVKLGNCLVKLPNGQTLSPVYAYVANKKGIAFKNGKPVALTSIQAENRKFEIKDETEMLNIINTCTKRHTKNHLDFEVIPPESLPKKFANSADGRYRRSYPRSEILKWIIVFALGFLAPVLRYLVPLLAKITSAGLIAVSVYQLERRGFFALPLKETVWLRKFDAVIFTSFYLLLDSWVDRWTETLKSPNIFGLCLLMMLSVAMMLILYLWTFFPERKLGLDRSQIQENRDRLARVLPYLLFLGLGGDFVVETIVVPAVVTILAVREIFEKTFKLRTEYIKMDEKLYLNWTEALNTPCRWAASNLDALSVLFAINLRFFDASLAVRINETAFQIIVDIDTFQLIYVVMLAISFASTFIAINKRVSEWKHASIAIVPIAALLFLGFAMPKSIPLVAFMWRTGLGLSEAVNALPILLILLIGTLIIWGYLAAHILEASRQCDIKGFNFYWLLETATFVIGFGLGVGALAIVLARTYFTGVFFSILPYSLLASQWGRSKQKQWMSLRCHFKLDDKPTKIGTITGGLVAASLSVFITTILYSMNLLPTMFPYHQILLLSVLFACGITSAYIGLSLKPNTEKLVVSSFYSGITCVVVLFSSWLISLYPTYPHLADILIQLGIWIVTIVSGAVLLSVARSYRLSYKWFIQLVKRPSRK